MPRTVLSLIGLVSIMLVPAADAQDVRMPAAFGPVRDYIESGIQEGLAPSVAVAVVKDDRVIWAEGFGLADIETHRRATSDSIYRLASLSKPLTATGLMVLVDRGLIDLDQPANAYLPGEKLKAYVGSAQDMTVRRLANHNAGLPPHHNFFYAESQLPSWDETIHRYGFAVTTPGTHWEYSNLAFGILGFITETVGRMPWREFQERNVYDPLRMIRTSDRVRPGHEGDATSQYTVDAAGRYVKVPPYAFDHPGASSIWSTVNDLARFLRMHLNGGDLDGVRVLKEESVRAMQRFAPGAVSETTGRQRRTGIAWDVTPYMGKTAFGHRGDMPGVSTMVRAYRNEKIATVVLTNTDRRGMAEEVTSRLARILFTDVKEEPIQVEDMSATPKTSMTVGSLAGNWQGRLIHQDGDIHLGLTVSEAGSIALNFNGRPPLSLQVLQLRDPIVAGQAVAFLRTQPGFHGIPTLVFRLERDGDRLRGVCVAQAQNYFALSHWVELRRQPEREPPAWSAQRDLRLLPDRYIGCLIACDLTEVCSWRNHENHQMAPSYSDAARRCSGARHGAFDRCFTSED